MVSTPGISTTVAAIPVKASTEESNYGFPFLRRIATVSID
jgi:hypothetical protein